MTLLRFNIPLDADIDKDELGSLAEVLQSEFGKEDFFGPAVVQPLGEGRSVAGVAAVIAVALPLVLDGAKALDALLGVFERLKKLQSSPKKTQDIFANISPDKILIDVDGVLVPLTKLTEEHLKALS